MNYVGRKDGGKYIPSSNTASSYDADRVIEIGYSKEVAELATELKRKYRDVFIELYKKAKEKA